MEGFKVCPVCDARCFPDMEVCFGCLHRFGDAERVAVVQDVVSEWETKSVDQALDEIEEAKVEACIEEAVASFPKVSERQAQVQARTVEASSGDLVEVEVRIKVPSSVLDALKAGE